MTTSERTTTGASASTRRLDFEEYVVAQRPALLRVARAISRDHDTAEDLLQSTLAGVFRRWSGIRDHRAADAYIRRAMVNTHTSWLRKRWRGHEQPTATPFESAAPRSPTESPSDRQALWSLVTELPPRQRATVVLRYYEDLSVAETAAVLDCSVGTVKSSASRGLSSLRRWLAGEDGDLAPAGTGRV